MEVSGSFTSGGGVSWLVSSFSPSFFGFSYSSSSSSSLSGGGGVSNSGGGATQWQWAQVAELVPLPDTVVAIARYFSLDLDADLDAHSISRVTGSVSGGEWTVHGNGRGISGSTGTDGGRGSSRSLRHRARFVESAVFCGGVALIIFTAACSG